MQPYRLLTYFTLLLLVLSVSCTSHEQFQRYLTDPEQRPAEQPEHVPEASSEPSPAEQESDEFASNRKVYSIKPLPIDSVQKGNVRVLKRAQKDLETFFVISRHLRTYRKKEELALIEIYAREYITEGIDTLLSLEFDEKSREVETLKFEIQYLKALLLYEIKDIVQACKTLESMDEQYSESARVNVEFIAGRLKTEDSHMVLANFKHMCHDSIMNKIEY